MARMSLSSTVWVSVVSGATAPLYLAVIALAGTLSYQLVEEPARTRLRPRPG